MEHHGSTAGTAAAGQLDEVDRAIEDAQIWRELIDRLIEHGESLSEAIGMADDMIHARHLRMQEGQTPSEPPPPPSIRPGEEEPLG